MSDHDANGIASEDWPDVPNVSAQSGQPLREGLDTGVRVMEDGRLDIKLSDNKPWVQKIIRHTKDHPYPCGPIDRKPSVSFSEGEDEQYPLRLNIVIQVVGSRGDIQPFLAIGKRLRSHGHRVRLATHLSFREVAEEEGLEFFDIGGDPAELMAFMVQNPGLLPDIRTIRSGAIPRRRREMKAIFSGCWRACYETGDGTGLEHHISADPWSDAIDYRNLPFVADVIIANPPSFSHISCAEKLGIPLNMMFTMPWSPTQAFPHPLASIRSQNTKPSVANFASYAVVEIMMWEGLGDLINRFRKREVGLDPLDAIRAPGIAQRLRIPYTYLWSPALLEKPLDWGANIDVVGFSVLPGAIDYTPPDDLKNFLDAGPPPVYVGFGSIVVNNPSRLTKIVFEAIRQTGQRAVISRGWGNIGADEVDTPEIMMIDRCPHDWLFRHVSCVVHHGGAGTTAAGLALSRPTVIVPFFGDQTFWGSIVARAGAGPEPIPYKVLTTEKLATAIYKALQNDTLKKASEIGEDMRAEEGVQNAVCSFYRHLKVESLRCSICPNRPAVWWVKRLHIKLSAFAAAVLVETGLVKPHDLVLYRSIEYDTGRDPRGPITAGAGVLYGVVTDFVAAMADIPTDMAEMFRGPHHHHHHHHHNKKLPYCHRLHHGQQIPPRVGRGKEDHDARQAPDLGVGSFSDGTKGDKPKSEETNQDTSHRGDTEESSSSNSSTTTERSYTSAKEELDDAGPSLDPGLEILSSIPTTENITNDMQTLCLENTLLRQQSRDKSHHDVRGILTDARYHAARAGKHLINSVLLLPTDLTLSLSKGFHNLPKVYHDRMVQETPTVRGLHGGLRAAGMEFTQEFYQAITGLVTQPCYGRKESGTKGMLKGVGKGIGGAFLKPAAGLWGLAGYPLDGLHKTLRNSLANSKMKDILCSRITQGLEEMVAASQEERAAVIRRWDEMHKSEANGHT
ncbi:hypothetical protein BDW59DRAFT_177966 [Aspergillus cavernicola]|uniref:Glycosyltransferase family 28 N-terminal domain-containing protein n=1 Tax=Aspergillus cavernicola TaxID=176166 RepID=A0ABR4HHY0_9EURO